MKQAKLDHESQSKLLQRLHQSKKEMHEQFMMRINEKEARERREIRLKRLRMNKSFTPVKDDNKRTRADRSVQEKDDRLLEEL